MAIEEIDKELNWTTEGILVQVHDELVLEGPDPVKLFGALKRGMEQSVSYGGRTWTPRIDVLVGRNWLESEMESVTNEEEVKSLCLP